MILASFIYTASFTVIFKRSVTPQTTPQADLTELENKIVSKIKINPKISRKELAVHLEITSDTVKEYLNKLKKKSILRRVGRTSAGYWEVKR